MGNTKSTVEIAADTSGYNRGIAQTEAAQRRWAAGVKSTQSELDNMTAAAKRAAAAAASVANETAKANAAAAAAKPGGKNDEAKARADAIAHQVKLLAAAGAEQSKIDALVQTELQLRSQIAAAEGNAAQARAMSQRAEIEAARAAARVEREAATAKAEAARATVATLRNEAEIIRQTASTQTASARAQAEASKAALELERQALELERAQAKTKGEQLAIDREIAKVTREAATAAAAARVSDGDRRKASAAGGAEQARAAADAARASMTSFDAARQSVGGFVDGLASIGLASIGLQALPGLINTVDSALTGLADATIAADRATYSLQLNIGGARAALGGTVTDLKLAQMANKAFALGVAKTGTDLTLVAAGVRVIAAKLGEDTETLFDNAITAIGRRSAMILDNLGIILNQTMAEERYAKSVGKTVKELSDQEKQLAFSREAMKQIGAAAKEAAKSNAAAAAAYKQMKTDMANAAMKAVGFNDKIGKVREGMRAMTDQQLRLLDNTRLQGGAITTLNATLEEQAILQQQQIEDATNVRVPLRDLQLTYEDIKFAADELGISIGELISRQREENEITRKSAANENAEKARVERNAELAKINEKNAEETEHLVELQRIMGVAEADLVEQMELALIYRKGAAEFAGDEAEATEYTRKIELLRAREAAGEFKKQSAGTSTAKELLKLQQQLQRDALAFAVEMAKANAADARSRMSREIDTLRFIELEREQLALRKAIAEAMPEKTRIQQAEKAIELQEIANEAEKQRRSEAKIAEEFAREGVEERLANINREIERNEALGVSIKLLVEQRRRAEMELVQRWGTMEQQADLVHAREIERIEAERANEAMRAQERADVQRRRIELLEAEGVVAAALHDQRVEMELGLARAERSHAAEREVLHRAEVERIKQRNAMQQNALGFTSSILGMQDSLNREFLQRAIKNDEKRAKAELRMRGVMAIATAALETVEGVAAIARYDYIGAALHFAAAATGYTLGTMMLMEKVPKQGGGSMGSASTAGAAGSGSFGEGLAEKQKPPPMPLSTDELDDARGSSAKKKSSTDGGNTTVININGPFVTNDASFGLGQIGERKAAAWG